ncbi:MAG: methyltransferase domain-containing protein, partial [Bryobacteraceae bacterium]
MGSDQGLRECLGRADCFFVFDRRERQIKHLRVIKGDLPIAAIERLESPIGGSVWVCAVTDCAGLSGRSLVLGKTRYTRLLDRFFLPDVPDPRVSVALFELCASVYDDIIERQRNIGTIRRLFELAAYHVARPNMKVLDFGCGTGLASDVLSVASLGPIRAMELYGTDASPAMLEHAKRRGMNTLSLGEWISLDGECFNVILAAYVLHYGVSDRDIRTICR